MQYKYELRDRAINSSVSVLREMLEVVSNHVFRDKGAGPIEKNFEICYYMPNQLVLELSEIRTEQLEAFRRELYNTKGVPRETNIYIFSKKDLEKPVFVLGKEGRKIFSIARGKVEV